MLQGILVVLQEDVQGEPEGGMKHSVTTASGLSAERSAAMRCVLHHEPNKMIGE